MSIGGLARTLVCALIFVVSSSGQVQASQENHDDLASLFAGFQTHHLSNSLRVWHKHLPDDPDHAQCSFLHRRLSHVLAG